MATIHDVARKAGVSSATVSHVMNNSRYVSPETRQRVLEAIDELRYRRDGIARSLRRARTSTIGVIISDITNPFFSDLVRGIEDRIYAREGGYNIILCDTDEHGERERMYLDVLQERRVEGMIIVPAGGNESYIEELVTGGLPIVFADRFLEGVDADAVLVDNRDGARRLTEHLAGFGHPRIAALVPALATVSVAERLDGYRQALAGAGIAFDPGLVQTCRSSIEDAHRAGLMLLDRQDRPTAVFCASNFMTLGMVQAIADRRLECPGDIAVVGFDDFPWATAFSPRLTALAQPAYALGAEAADLLFARIAHERIGLPVRRILKGDLIVRDSGGPSRSGAAQPQERGGGGGDRSS
jgi:LacI family transcriptional regulator